MLAIRSSVLTTAILFLLSGSAWANWQAEESGLDDGSRKEILRQEDSDSDSTPVSKSKHKRLLPTHKQSRVFRPTHNGVPIKLSTITVDGQGNLVACLGGVSYDYVVENDDNGQSVATHKKIAQPAVINTYTQELELARSVSIDFTATAVNFDKEGNMYAAGEGVIAKFDTSGQEVLRVKPPNFEDKDTARERVRELIIAQYKQQEQLYKETLENLEKQIAKIEEKDEADRTKIEIRRLSRYRLEYESGKEILKQLGGEFALTDEMLDQAVESMMANSSGVRSIAVNDNHVYVTCNGGFGFDIWRMGLDLQDAERVLEGVSGCCGQMDVQAAKDTFFVAENANFRVANYDQNGKLLSAFGGRNRDGQSGFGSCCNPMNLRCCSNGDILTAESSIGHIKRFNAEGELIAYVGKAKVGGGCKHVALGHDAVHDIYYMMYEDEDAVCVLEPKERVGVTEAEKRAKEAIEGLGKRLVGEWIVDNGEEAQGEDVTESEAANSPIQAMAVEEVMVFEEVHFDSSGWFTAIHPEGRDLTGWLGNQWRPVKQDGNKIWLVLVRDEVDSGEAIVTFLGENKIQLDLEFFESKFSWTCKRNGNNSEETETKSK